MRFVVFLFLRSAGGFGFLKCQRLRRDCCRGFVSCFAAGVLIPLFVQGIRDVRREIIRVCESRMRVSDVGNTDTFVVLLNRLKSCNKIEKLPPAKKRFGKLVNDFVDNMLQNIEHLKGHSGAARIIFGQFTGRSASILHRRMTKEFTEAAVNGYVDVSPAGASRAGVSHAHVPHAPIPQRPAAARRPVPFNRPVVPRFDPNKDLCFNCGGKGHMSRDCEFKRELRR